MVYKFCTQFNINPTGAAGVAGALVYAGLTFLISPKATLLIQLFMPMVMLVTFLFILGKPRKILPTEQNGSVGHIQNQNVDQGASDDSKPLLGGETKRKLRFFNKEEAGQFVESVGVSQVIMKLIQL